MTTIASTMENFDNNNKKSTSTLRHRLCDNNKNKEQQTKEPVSIKEQTSSSSPLHCGNSYSNQGFYDCNICFDTAIYPVLTICGHLFCWVCLSRWLEQQDFNPTCPMCKAGCSEDKIIPIYGRGYEEVDPRYNDSIPSRPSGQRPEPLYNPNIAGSSLFQSLRSDQRYLEGNSIFISNPRISSNYNNQSNGFLSRLMLMILSLFIVVIVFY
ncbi:unnamed protein product [Cunninghamella echinulata]